jgi:hypothetical protein
MPMSPRWVEVLVSSSSFSASSVVLFICLIRHSFVDFLHIINHLLNLLIGPKPIFKSITVSRCPGGQNCLSFLRNPNAVVPKPLNSVTDMRGVHLISAALFCAALSAAGPLRRDVAHEQ